MQKQLSGIDLGYILPDGKPLFSSLTFSFNRERTGLIGANGIGKSTLLEILVGNIRASSGTLVRPDRVSYLPQAESFEPDATVAAALGVESELVANRRIANGEPAASDFEQSAGLWDLPARIHEALARLEISYLTTDQNLTTLSPGELMRVRLARLLLEEPEFLLLDEPTNHLDRAAREFIYRLIGSWKAGLVVVSHDRELLAMVDQIAEMDSAGLKFYGGNFLFYREQRAIDKAAAEETLLKARRRLKSAEATRRETLERQQKRSASGYKRGVRTGLSRMAIGNLRRHAENSASRLKDRHQKRVEAVRREVQSARARFVPQASITVDLAVSGVPARKRIIELSGVNYRYPGAAASLWPEPLNIDISGGERVSIAGPNGSGKSTLIDIACGRKQPSAGAVKLGTERIGVLDQEVAALDDGLSLFDNLRRVAPAREQSDLRILLSRFLFYRDSVFKRASTLSGGERVRGGLACLLGADQSPELLILDEPTNNLDLQGIEAVTEALKQFRGTLVVVSHDMTFLEEIGIGRSIELRR